MNLRQNTQKTCKVCSVNSVDDLAFQLGRHCSDSARKEAKIVSGKKSMGYIVNLSVQSTLSTNNKEKHGIYCKLKCTINTVN